MSQREAAGEGCLLSNNTVLAVQQYSTLLHARPHAYSKVHTADTLYVPGDAGEEASCVELVSQVLVQLLVGAHTLLELALDVLGALWRGGGFGGAGEMCAREGGKGHRGGENVWVQEVCCERWCRGAVATCDSKCITTTTLVQGGEQTHKTRQQPSAKWSDSFLQASRLSAAQRAARQQEVRVMEVLQLHHMATQHANNNKNSAQTALLKYHQDHDN